MKKRSITLLALTALIFTACAIAPKVVSVEKGIYQTPQDQTLGENYYHLNQGWSDKDRESFYYISQGSRMMPYSWFLALEQPGNSNGAYFKDIAFMDKYKFINMPKSSKNPDALPVGFANDKYDGKEWLGLNCAACHTGQIEYEDKIITIDGAPGMFTLAGFLTDVTTALKETKSDTKKFSRFATTIYKTEPTIVQKEKLRSELDTIIELREGWQLRNHSNVEYGYARTDAFGIIPNQVAAMGLKLDTPKPNGNVQVPNAPVSFPHLWDIAQDSYKHVQWNGIASNSPKVLGALGRNGGEVLGVFGKVHIDGSATGYRSTLKLHNLLWIESNIKNLVMPQWIPVFPTVDTKMADAGRKIYEANCVSCHTDMNPFAKDRKMITCMQPLDSIKTDNTMATNFANNNVKTGVLEGKKAKIFAGDKIKTQEQVGVILSNTVLGSIEGSITKSKLTGATDFDLSKPHTSLKTKLTDFKHNVSEDFAILSNVMTKVKSGSAYLKEVPYDKEYVKHDGYETNPCDFSDAVNPLAYKSRPMNGIWATAPFLHNGSVPNMWELLTPAKDRVKKFYVGSRKYDTKNLGFEHSTKDNNFLYDTSIKGNYNSGHEYGVELSDKQKWELIEYMKTL